MMTATGKVKAALGIVRAHGIKPMYIELRKDTFVQLVNENSLRGQGGVVVATHKLLRVVGKGSDNKYPAFDGIEISECEWDRVWYTARQSPFERKWFPI